MSDAPGATRSIFPKNHPTVKYGRIGVLLVNLGTPDRTDYWSVRRYLKQFLSDRRVIDTNRLIWWPILNLIILTIRPGRSGKAYKAIWNTAQDESPLRTVTRAQYEKLTSRLNPGILVDWAMRYGTPSIEERLNVLKEAGADRILLFPLYPQYAAPTTASVQDNAFSALKKMRWQPAIRTAPAFYDDDDYIRTLANSVNVHLDGLGWRPEIILSSFHGVPQRYLKLGDPYHCHCQKTARLLRAQLGLAEHELQITFQSRFGLEAWLQPYTDETIATLAKRGVKNLAVISPAFISDCVETLEELAIGGREIFLEAGGKNFTVIPCLNDSPAGMNLIENLVRRELSGWI